MAPWSALKPRRLLVKPVRAARKLLDRLGFHRFERQRDDGESSSDQEIGGRNLQYQELESVSRSELAAPFGVSTAPAAAFHLQS
jgi:hypothetical protein